LKTPEIKSRFARIKQWVGPVFILGMLVAALWLLHVELRDYHLEDFRKGFDAIPFWKLAVAVLLTLLNYLILVGYDWLGVLYIRHPMSFGRVALASFLGNSVGNNFGMLFGGSTIRYRLYSTWGVSATDIVKLVFTLVITFWIGLFGLSGTVFLIDPLPIPNELQMGMETTRPLGIILSTIAGLYLLVCAIGKPLRIFKKEISPPPLGLSICQYIVASIDLLVAAAIVYVLLPEGIDISYPKFVGIFLLAQVAVFLTQIPGGLGILEMSLLALLAPASDVKPVLFASLLTYRVIFYLTPMAIGIAMLAGNEIVMQREHLRRFFGSFGSWTPDIAPRLASLLVFLCGVFVVFAGVFPVADIRMERLSGFLPLWLVETGSLLRGVLGVLLLLLARDLYRRIRFGWRLTLATLAATTVAVILSSLEYFQAGLLMATAAVVGPLKHYFHRRGRLLTDRIAWSWVISIGVVMFLAFWFFLFAYRRDGDYGFDFWRFGWSEDAPRSVRALLGGAAVGVGFFAYRVLSVLSGSMETTTRRELQVAARIAGRSANPSAWLALGGDKRLLFNEKNTAMVAWSVRNQNCVSVGDPSGSAADAFQIAWDFNEMCQQQALRPVFFLASREYRPLFEEMNLRLLHIADEAIIDLRRRGAEGSVFQSMTATPDAVYRYRVLTGPEVESLVPELARVDAAWQAERGGRPLKFSSAIFVADQIASTPVLVMEQDSRLVAFATLWPGADGETMSCGLIRYLPDSPTGVLDGLLAEVIRHARASGCQRFSFGPAPVADWQSPALQEVRTQVMTISFRMSPHFYSYQGLRNYLDRFSPDWEPLFLACPAGQPVSSILEDISMLIGSGDWPKSRLGKPA
jgi:phosphatidylglycerol lysyltransferase